MQTIPEGSAPAGDRVTRDASPSPEVSLQEPPQSSAVAGSTAEATGGDTLRLSGLPVRRPVPKPVFVDMSGGRRRRLRILVAALVTPAVAYVALLISTFVGGPTLPALLPQPLRPRTGAVAEHVHRTPRDSASSTGAAAGSVQRQRGSGLATTVSKGVGSASAKATSSATATTVTSSPTAKPSATASPSPSPTRFKGHGRSPHAKRSPTVSPSASPTHLTSGL